MSDYTIQIVELNDSDPRLRGQSYGESARQRIHKILEVYRNIFRKVTGQDWQQILERVQPVLLMAKRFAPDLIIEIEGIAEGANRSFEEIFLLNARSEVLYSSDVLTQECTTIAVLPEASRNGEMILAQNWDWYKEVADCQVILKIAGHNGKPAVTTFTEAGQLAKIGMNDKGIGLVVNNLLSDQPRSGVPWILITRRVLESSSLAEALGYIMNTQRAHSLNFMVGSAEGEAINVETAPVESNILWPENGCLVHSNHYLQQGKQFTDLKPIRTPYLSTYLRFGRTRHFLAKRYGTNDIDSVREILSDHTDKPFSVCAHENPAIEPLLQSITCLSVIMNMSKGEIHYCPGNPCSGNFQIL